MVKIITDTSSLYSPEEGQKLGFDVMCLNVYVDGKSYREYADISSADFLELVKQGHLPSSSQPAIGAVMELYETYTNEEVIVICMADGLSGTYQSALGAKAGLDHSENIHVINSRTLCGPHRYLVDVAVKMVKEGKKSSEIIRKLEMLMNTTRSFLLPQDFDFLKRGGRLTPLAAKLGGLLKIQPVMTQTQEGTRLEKFSVARTFMGGIQTVFKEFSKEKDPNACRVYITHAGVSAQAQKVKEYFLQRFPELIIEIHELSPVFITQGGPGCLAIQWISC